MSGYDDYNEELSFRMHLHVTTQSAVVRLRGAELHVEDEDGATQLELARVASVNLHGRVEITTPAMLKLVKKRIPVQFYSRSGRLKAMLLNGPSAGLPLRRTQHSLERLREFKPVIAREILRGKLAGCTRLLRNYRRMLGPDSLDWRDAWRSLSPLADVETLRGIEGNAAKRYWQLFARLLRGDHGFESRRAHPPRDPVNSLLSYGYSILTGRVQACVIGAGLEPGYGYLHATDESRPTLALDLVEPFRALCVDRFVLRNWNTGVFDSDDFEISEAGCWLKPAARSVYLRRFHAWLRRPLRRSLRPRRLKFPVHLLNMIDMNVARFYFWMFEPQQLPELWPPSPPGLE